MAKYFLTKTWGFQPDSDPVMGFNTLGARRKFKRESEPGDWIVIAGTRESPTDPGEQGRLLGMVQVGTIEVDSLALLRSIDAYIPPDHFDKNGVYRWPYGLAIVNARRFVGTPDLKQTLGTANYLSGTEWAAYAINVEDRLGSAAVDALANLQTVEAPIADAPALVQPRAFQKSVLLTKAGFTGPGPSLSRKASLSEDGPGYAYVLQLKTKDSRDHYKARNVFKVGYTKDLATRLHTLNAGLLESVTGYSWKLINWLAFETRTQAYRFEQAVHQNLRPHLKRGEAEIYEVPEESLLSEWSQVYSHGDWAG